MMNLRVFTHQSVTAATAGAAAALYGPLHGGANEAVLKMLMEIGDVKNVPGYIERVKSREVLLQGFGHRVYKQGDSRVPTMKNCFEGLTRWSGDTKWLDIYNILTNIFINEKGIYPNLDFPSGPAYYLMGFPVNLYTPIFVMSRITGWSAHYMEQNANNALIRPLSAYSGKAQRKVSSITERK